HSRHPASQCGGQIARRYFKFRRVDGSHGAHHGGFFLGSKSHDDYFIQHSVVGLHDYIDPGLAINKDFLPFVPNVGKYQRFRIVRNREDISTIDVRGGTNSIGILDQNIDPYQGFAILIGDGSGDFKIHSFPRENGMTIYISREENKYYNPCKRLIIMPFRTTE